MPKFQDLTGQKFGELLVLERAEDYILPCGKHQTMWKCQCSCGKITITRALQLKNGESQSCGHLQKIRAAQAGAKKIKLPTYDLSHEYGLGYTTQGIMFIFDLEDYEKIKDIPWKVNRNGYLCAKVNKKNIMMSRLILDVTDPKILVDHIHGSKTCLDNRKSNLRCATVSQNGMNKKLSAYSTSGVTGVGFDAKRNKWRARIKVNKFDMHLGYFETKEEAIHARQLAEDKYFGEYSYRKSQEEFNRG